MVQKTRETVKRTGSRCFRIRDRNFADGISDRNRTHANPVVQKALDDAWNDSIPDIRELRHEEGGWIYFQPNTKEIKIRRSPSGGDDFIDFGQPDAINGFVIVATYHTHPNPTAEGWNPGPSPRDISLHERLGIPGLIRSDIGVQYCGPDHRRENAIGIPQEYKE